MPTIDHRTDTTVALMGDVHANVAWIQKTIPFLRRNRVHTVYQVGDLGYWGPGDPFIKSLEHWLDLAQIDLFCTPGNHENWAALDLLFAVDPGLPVALSPHVTMLPPRLPLVPRRPDPTVSGWRAVHRLRVPDAAEKLVAERSAHRD